MKTHVCEAPHYSSTESQWTMSINSPSHAVHFRFVFTPVYRIVTQPTEVMFTNRISPDINKVFLLLSIISSGTFSRPPLGPQSPTWSSSNSSTEERILTGILTAERGGAAALEAPIGGG